MDLRTFVETYRRFRLVPAACLLITLLGVFFYHQKYDTATAQATLSVLDPLTARPGVYSDAQITFDSVIKSRRLAEQVGARLHRTPDDIAGHLSVTIVPTLASINPSPVYAVRGSDRNPSHALQLANVAAAEGRALYVQLNRPDPGASILAMQPQVDQAQAQLTKAKDTLNAFTGANNAHDLSTRLARQRDIVTSFQLQIHQVNADLAAVGGTNSGTHQALARRAASLAASMSAEQLELNRLVNLQTQFDDLSAKVAAAYQHVTQVQQLQQNLADGAQSLPLTSDVKLVDEARLQSKALFAMLTYAMAVLLGLTAGASAIYLLGLFAQQMETPGRVAEAFGAPVLVRVPAVTT